MNRCVGLVAVASAALLLPTAFGQDKTEEDARGILGDWVVVSQTRDGWLEPYQVGKPLAFSGGTMSSPDGSPDINYRLDAHTTPRSITLEASLGGTRKSVLGIYELRGDTLRLCLAGPSSPKPTQFVSRVGDKRLLIVLTREGQPRSGRRPRIVPLPVITLETTKAGRDVGPHEEQFTGIRGLPIAVRLDTCILPLGFEEKTTAASLTVGKVNYQATHCRWSSPQASGIGNYNSRQIDFWVSEQCGSPEFMVDELRIPAGCVRFEFLPADPHEPPTHGVFGEHAFAAIHGELTGRQTVTLAGKDHDVYRYVFEGVSSKGKVREEIWVSETIPGSVYRVAVEDNVASPVRSEATWVKRVEPEKLAGDLVEYPKAMFAIRPPRGWEAVKPQGDEVVRYVPTRREGPESGHALTVEVLDAKGKRMDAWANHFHDTHPGQYGVFFDFGLAMGDLPTFTLDHWAGSDKPARAVIVGTQRRGMVYLAAMWLPRIKEHQNLEDATLREFVKSWRWLHIATP